MRKNVFEALNGFDVCEQLRRETEKGEIKQMALIFYTYELVILFLIKPN